MTKKPTAIGGLNTPPLPPISSNHNRLPLPKSSSSPLLSPKVTKKTLFKRRSLPISSEVIGTSLLPTLHSRYKPLPKINELAIDIDLIKNKKRFDELLEQIQIKRISLQILADICECYLKYHGTLDEEIVSAWLEDNKYSEDILKPSNDLWKKFGTSANYVREAFVRKYVEESENLGADSLARILNDNQDLPARKIIKIWLKGLIDWLSEEESKEKIEALLEDESLLEEFGDLKDYVKTKCQHELKKLHKAEPEKYKSEYEELANLSDVELISYLEESKSGVGAEAFAKDFSQNRSSSKDAKLIIDAWVSNHHNIKSCIDLVEPEEEFETLSVVKITSGEYFLDQFGNLDRYLEDKFDDAYEKYQSKAAAKDFMKKMADGMVSKKSARVKNRIRGRDVDSILEPIEEIEEEESGAKTAISPSSSRAMGPASTHSTDKSPPR